MTHLACLINSTNVQIMEQDFQAVAQQSWFRSASRSFADKTRYLVVDLRKWRKKKPRLKDQLEAVENLLPQQQLKPPQQQDFDLQKHLTQQHQHLLLKDEELHLQRAKKNWATKGDRNTSFFHHAIIKRNRKNTITFLQNHDGTHATTTDQIAQTLNTYFKHIFASNDTPNSITNAQTNTHSAPISNSMQEGPNLQSDSPTAHTADDQQAAANLDIHQLQFTNSIPDVQELHTIIKNMRTNASPRPDGLNAGFFKVAWPWISQDIKQL